MSGLRNLFGSSGGSDTNDALKYTAPKEPKKGGGGGGVAAQSAAASGSTTAVPLAAAAPSANSAEGSAVPQSKVMAMAGVRLYRVGNTGAYETVEGGNALGCVVMGCGVNYQILIYNGQKVPQALVPLLATFRYTTRDLYMSFSDDKGNNLSILFDSTDAMAKVIRIIMATVAHVSGLTGAKSDDIVKGTFPPVSAAASADDVSLAQGMVAGVYISVWEMGEYNDFPSDLMNNALKTVQPPTEVLKVKIGQEDEIIGGLSNALIGLKKGERMIMCVPPKVAYRNCSDKAAILSSSVRPTCWLLVEVEISKVKSSSASEKGEKKGGGGASSGSSDAVESTGSETGSGSGNLASRMARLAQASGGGHILSAAAVSITASASTSAPAAQPSQSSVQAQAQETSTYAQNQSPSYALTVVEGSQASSPYLQQQQPQQQPQQQQIYHQQPMYAQPPVYAMPPMPPPPQPSTMSEATLSSNFNQIQQSLLGLQSNVMQIQGKVEQTNILISAQSQALVNSQMMSGGGMGMGGSNSMQLQQMQQQMQMMQQQMMGIGGMGGAMGMGMGMGMGMNNMMGNNLMGNNMIGNNMPGNGLMGNNSTGSALRLKSTELIGHLQSMVEEYERVVLTGTGSNNINSQRQSTLIENGNSNGEKLREQEEKLKTQQVQIEALERDSATLSAKVQEGLSREAQAEVKKQQIEKQYMDKQIAMGLEFDTECANYERSIAALKEELSSLRASTSSVNDHMLPKQDHDSIVQGHLSRIDSMQVELTAATTHLSSLENEMNEIKDQKRQVEDALQIMASDKAKAEAALVSQREEAAAALQAVAAQQGQGKSAEEVKAIMQSIFEKVVSILEESGQESFNADVISKVLKKALKIVASENL